MSFVSSLGRVQESILIKNRMLLCNTLLNSFSMVRPKYFHREKALTSPKYYSVLLVFVTQIATNGMINIIMKQDTKARQPKSSMHTSNPSVKRMSHGALPKTFSNIVSNRWQQSPCLFVFGYNIIIFYNSAGIMFIRGS